MALYQFDDLLLEIQPDAASARARLPSLLSDLSWTLTTPGSDDRLDRLSLRLHAGAATIPVGGQQTVSTTSFCGFQLDDTFHLTDHRSILRLDATRGEADAYLAESFFDKPLMEQFTFWAFAIARLLRARGRYVLHAAGLASPDGDLGVLVIGPSGSGKSTLTLAALRHGWRYLSDDAVVLRAVESTAGGPGSSQRAASVIARGVRRHCYVDADAVPSHAEFRFGGEMPDTSGSSRRRVMLEEPLSGCRVDACLPRLLLFPRIADAERSQFVSLDRVASFSRLLEASCDQLWDRRTMTLHTQVVSDLVRQTHACELRAGRDVFQDASSLFREMRALASDEEPCVAS
jgi:hypothetical protein